jgi:glycosyltransferase involved in cell wall biosynthesis
MPFVSVIIPTYNRLSLLQESLESVRHQSFGDFEIIVVNDGSQDGTKEWLAKQPDILAINQKNRGIAASRNMGAAVAQGDWFSFLDHDDLWTPEKLDTQVKFIKECPEVGMVSARHVRLGKNSTKQSDPTWIKGDLYRKEFAESFIHTSSVMIRRDVFWDNNGFPTNYRFADEFDVWLKITKKYQAAHFNGVLVYIRFYDANTSHNRIGVRSDTYNILMDNYDPERIPEDIFLQTMSNHDISFGRAYLQVGDTKRAVEWFKKSIQRTPYRFRSWRYFIKYWLKSKLIRNVDCQ